MFNKTTLTAIGLALAGGLLIGLSFGLASNTTFVTECSVEAQKFAEFEEQRRLGDEIVSLINRKFRLQSEVSEAEMELESLADERELLIMTLNDLRLAIQETRDNMERTTQQTGSAFRTRTTVK